MEQIRILGVTISATPNGLYSVTDLWKASGSKSKNLPEKWLRNKASIEYADYLKTLESNVSQKWVAVENQRVIDIFNGNNGGTYMCKELVYAYAMWISPVFSHAVISTFDAVLNDNLELAKQIAKGMVEQEVKMREPNDVGTLAYLMGCSTFESQYHYKYLVDNGYLTFSRDKYGQATYRPTEKGKAYTADKQTKPRTLLFKTNVIEVLK